MGAYLYFLSFSLQKQQTKEDKLVGLRTDWRRKSTFDGRGDL